MLEKNKRYFLGLTVYAAEDLAIFLGAKIFRNCCGGGMEQYLSAAQVGKEVGVHYRTIENWAAQGFLGRDGGKYGLLSAFKHQIEKLKEENKGLKDNPKAELQLQKLAEEVSERRAIARIKNMEADLMAGKLIDAGEALIEWQNAIANAKAKFIAIPAKMALELSGLNLAADIEARLREVIDEALFELGS